MCALFDDPNNALYQHMNLHHAHATTPMTITHHYPLLNANNNNSMDSSQSVDKHPKQINNKRKSKEASSPNSAQSKEMRGVKGKKKKNCDEEKQVGEAHKGYVHVRARRGQATDSHSLAERMRRERISERMKLLQALVPGCDKVTGKVLMLDEIINYIQSLLNQIEFLSMKLASFNPILYDFGIELESFMERPDQDLNSLPSQLPTDMQECSPTTANTYPPVPDNSVNSLLLHQSHLPNALPQGDRHALWEVDDQRHKIINQSGINSNLFS